MDIKKISGNASKATLPNNEKLSDKIQNNKLKSSVNSAPGTTGLSDSNLESNDQSKKENNSKTAMQQGGTEVAKEALKKAASTIPYTKWIPKGIRDKIIDKVMDSGAGQEAVKRATTKLKLAIIGAVASLILSALLTFVLFYATVVAPISLVSNAVEGIGSFFTSMGHWFIGEGWCSTTEKCQANAEAAYYEKLDSVIKKYEDKNQVGCKINQDLITATIFYGQMFSEKGLTIDEKDKDLTGYDYLDVSESYGKQSAESRVNKLVKAYFEGNADLDSDDDSMPDLDSCYFSARAYRQYLINTYIPSSYPSIINNNVTVEKIADDIMSMGNISLINNSFSSSLYCSSIAVEQNDGTIETMDLETYVSRVVTQENSWYDGNNIESMKAQAVASRTYALNATKNCKNPIKNSQSAQTLAATPSSMAVRAAEETNSEVLLKDGSVFSSQYDAFACIAKDQNFYTVAQANLQIPKPFIESQLSPSKNPNWFICNGKENLVNHHGNGMSQYGSRYLQSIGKNYNEILTTFYTDAVVGKMGGLISGGNYYSNIGPAVNKTELAERRNLYAGSLDIYSDKASNVSQCPWYAKSRAIEIVYGSNIPEQLKQAAINSLKATNGNGTDWFKNPDSTYFTKETDYTKPKPGSIVSWSSGGGPKCHHYGHVAIVEQVNDDGTLLLSDSYNSGGADSKNSWSSISYQVYKASLNYVKSHNNASGCTYTFNGYVYLLG